MKMPRNLVDSSTLNHRRKKFYFAAIIIICILFIMLLINYFYNAALNFKKPLSLGDYTSQDSCWSFYVVDNGKKSPITPENIDGEAVLKADMPVHCETVLTFTFEDTVLDLGEVNYPVAVFLDDKLVFANSDITGEPDDINFNGAARISTNNTVVTLPDSYVGKTLQVVFLPDSGKVILPEIKMSSVKTIFGQESANVVDGIVRAVYSLIFAIITVCIFLVEKVRGKTDFAMLVLIFYFAICVLMPVNLEYSTLSDSMKNILTEYRVAEFMSAFATAVMLVFFTLKAKKYCKPILIIVVAYAAVVFVSYGVACYLGTAAVDKIIAVAYILYYIQLVMVFIIGFIEWRDGSFFFKYYIILASIGVVGLVVWCFRIFGFNWLSQPDIITFLSTTKHAYLQPFLSICSVVVAAIEFVADAIYTATYVHALTTRNQLTTEYISNLNDTIDAVRRTRHEMRHHLETMRIMSENKYYDKLDEYIKQLHAEESKVKVLYYSENRIVSAIISSKLRDAQEKQVETDISVNIPENFSVNRMAFASFLMNLLENAMEACAKVPLEQGRWIKLKIMMKNDKVTIACANSSSGQTHRLSGKFITSKEDPDKHGLGISIMQQCCESVGGSMVIEENNGSFTVRAVFPLSKQPE